MKPRLIVLIDFSPYSSELLEFAYSWSQKVNAELVLVHQTVISAPALADYQSRIDITNIAMREALEKLKDFAESVLPHGSGIHYRITDQKLESYLSRLLQEPFYHLIFLGLKGTGILKKIFIGSTAVQIIDNINTAVIAMPKGVSQFSATSLYLAINRNYPLNMIDLNDFLNFMGEDIKKISIFSILQPSDDIKGVEEHLKAVQNLYADKYDTNIVLYEGANVFEEVQKIMAQQKDALLVVQRGSRMFMDKMFRKFLINDLVYAGHTPLLILP